jgi:hypothetical protein
MLESPGDKARVRAERTTFFLLDRDFDVEKLDRWSLW